MKRSSLAAFCVVFFGGCASSGGLTPGSGAAVPALPDAMAARGKGSVVIALPPIRGQGAPIDWNVGMLSSATTSATVTIGTKKHAPIALKASNNHCIGATDGLTCTLVIPVKPGQNKKIVVQTYAIGVTQPLARGQTTTNLYPGHNTVDVQMAGIARKLKLVPDTKTLHHGQYLLDKIYLRAYDAARTLIPSMSTVAPSGHEFKVSLKYSGFATSADAVGYNYYFYTAGLLTTFPYDGVASGTETITANPYVNYGHPIDIPAAKTTLTVVSGNTDLALLAFGIYVSTPTNYGAKTIGQFSLNGSSSSAGPVRQFINPYHTTSSSRTTPFPVFGEDSSGNFWIGNVHVSNSLSVLGTVTLPSNVPYPIAADRQGHLYATGRTDSGACAVFEYPNQYGSLKAIREIDGPCASRVTTDAGGNVYVADTFDVPIGGGLYQGGFGVQEFAANGGSGKIDPIRNMVEAQGVSPYGAGFVGLDVDNAGNVYVAAQTEGFAKPNPSNVVYEFAPGETTGTQRLGGLQVDAFTVDDAGDIFALVGNSLEEFAPGETTPTRTISEPAYYGSPLVVPH